MLVMQHTLSAAWGPPQALADELQPGPMNRSAARTGVQGLGIAGAALRSATTFCAAGRSPTKRV